MLAAKQSVIPWSVLALACQLHQWVNLTMELGSKLSSHLLAQSIKKRCDEHPTYAFGTSELATYLEFEFKASSRQEIYNCLKALVKPDFPYVTKGDAVIRSVYGKPTEVYPNLWRCPETGPVELPEIKKEVPLATRVAWLEEEVAQLRALLSLR